MHPSSPERTCVESIMSVLLIVTRGYHMRAASRRTVPIILLSALVILGLSGCSHDNAVDFPAADSPSTVDYWPMVTGNQWTFNYTFHFRDDDNYGVGKAIGGSYGGTLTWKIISTTQLETGFKCTFKQKFVGIAVETVMRSEPNDFVTNTYNIEDTTYTFDLTMQANQLIRLSADAYPLWQYRGTLGTVINGIDIYRFPPHTTTLDTLTYTSGTLGLIIEVALARLVGPIRMTYAISTNTQDRHLSAELVSHTQRNERTTNGKPALAH
jgi:hypothetical protein